MWTEVDRYIADRLIRDGVGGDGFAHDHAVSPPQGALLELLALAIGARAEVVTGPALETPALEGPFDLVFIDAGPRGHDGFALALVGG